MIAFVIMDRSISCDAQLVKKVQYVARIVSINAKASQQVGLRLTRVSRPGPGIAEQRGFPLGHSAAGRLFRCVCGFLMNATRPALGSQAAQQG